MAPGNVYRIERELSQIRSNSNLKHVHVDDSDVRVWNALLCPVSPPYNKGAFKITIILPTEYPFKPPRVNFITKIYHPNIDEQGQVCLKTLNPECWKPATKVSNVIEDLMNLIDNPEPDHPLREDVAQLYMKDQKKFFQIAEEFTRRNSEKMDANPMAHSEKMDLMAQCCN